MRSPLCQALLAPSLPSLVVTHRLARLVLSPAPFLARAPRTEVLRMRSSLTFF